MDETPGNDPQHVLGMPTEPGRLRPRVDDTEQRVLGVPLSWYRTDRVELGGFRHPIRWVTWRIRRHRLGPYAPDLGEDVAGSPEP